MVPQSQSLMADTSGATLFVASSYKKMLEDIAQPVLDAAEVHFSTEVTQVKNLELMSQEQPSIQVTTAKGDTSIFDQVIVSSPLGYLQQHKQIFSPPIPPALSRAIDAIHYGHLEKVYIAFPSAWWETPEEASNWEGPIWTAPAYAPETNPEGWVQQCIVYSGFPEPARQPVLLFYIFGANAAHITSLLAGHDRSSPQYTNILTSFFHPYYSKLPNFQPDSAICKPSGFLATDWTHDRLAGNGSYTNYQVGLEDGKAALDTIRAGMGLDRGVWLAGEHGAPYIALGTVVGAYWSGERVARQICAQYGLPGGEDLDPDGVWEEQEVGSAEARVNLGEQQVDGVADSGA